MFEVFRGAARFSTKKRQKHGLHVLDEVDPVSAFVTEDDDPYDVWTDGEGFESSNEGKDEVTKAQTTVAAASTAAANLSVSSGPAVTPLPNHPTRFRVGSDLYVIKSIIMIF